MHTDISHFRAVDGFTNTDLFTSGKECTHTADKDTMRPWWLVDLQTPQRVTHLIITTEEETAAVIKLVWGRGGDVDPDGSQFAEDCDSL